MTALHAFGLGVATGGRSTSGLAAVAWTTDPRTPGPVGRLASRNGRLAAAVLAAAEAVADKLPAAPSRLAPPGAVVRGAAGLAGGAALGARDGVDPRLTAATALAGAGVGAVAGVRWRSWAGGRGWPGPVAALAEDAVVAALAWWSSRPQPVEPVTVSPTDLP